MVTIFAYILPVWWSSRYTTSSIDRPADILLAVCPGIAGQSGLLTFSNCWYPVYCNHGYYWSRKKDAPVFMKKEIATLIQHIEILDWHHKNGKNQRRTAAHFDKCYLNLIL